MDYSLPGSSIHGIFQARVLEWGAIAFSMKVRKEEKMRMPGMLQSKRSQRVGPDLATEQQQQENYQIK